LSVKAQTAVQFLVKGN
nr:carbamoyl-phosphate synthetase I - rat (fragments) [Rattus norvegicus]